MSSHDDLLAVGALIELSRDSHSLVRDWATFGIGQQTSLDSTEIREALLERGEDDDPVVRGEALMGLAQRQDLRVVPLIHRELCGEFHGSWAVEAAKMMADMSFYTPLLSLHERLDTEHQKRFEYDFRAALLACGTRP